MAQPVEMDFGVCEKILILVQNLLIFLYVVTFSMTPGLTHFSIECILEIKASEA
jgi:hypothetical protein